MIGTRKRHIRDGGGTHAQPQLERTIKAALTGLPRQAQFTGYREAHDRGDQAAGQSHGGAGRAQRDRSGALDVEYVLEAELAVEPKRQRIGLDLHGAELGGHLDESELVQFQEVHAVLIVIVLDRPGAACTERGAGTSNLADCPEHHIRTKTIAIRLEHAAERARDGSSTAQARLALGREGAAHPRIGEAENLIPRNTFQSQGLLDRASRGIHDQLALALQPNSLKFHSAVQEQRAGHLDVRSDAQGAAAAAQGPDLHRERPRSRTQVAQTEHLDSGGGLQRPSHRIRHQLGRQHHRTAQAQERIVHPVAVEIRGHLGSLNVRETVHSQNAARQPGVGPEFDRTTDAGAALEIRP